MGTITYILHKTIGIMDSDEKTMNTSKAERLVAITKKVGIKDVYVTSLEGFEVF